MEMAILALDEELQEIVLYQKCSPECQLKVEPSTAFIGCHILEIFHFLRQKLVLRLLKMLEKGLFWLRMKSYKKKITTKNVLLNVSYF